ncbi:hypothetical protein QJR26_06970 [Clostridium baratii]
MKVNINFNFDKNTDLEVVLRKLDKIGRALPGLEIEANINEVKFLDTEPGITEALKIERKEEFENDKKDAE